MPRLRASLAAAVACLALPIAVGSTPAHGSGHPLAPGHRITRTVLPEDPAALARLDADPPALYHGAGFDPCAAPPLSAMAAWKAASPYRAIGIFTSGDQHRCADPLLTRAWVGSVRAMGWKVVPLDIGLQAPCSDYPGKPLHIDPVHAVDQGRAEATRAVAGLDALGIGAGSPVYSDMEAYPQDSPGCAQAVVDFALGWTAQLHSLGDRSGFYSSMDSGIADMMSAARAGCSPLPDALWYARWDGRADTAGSGYLTDDLWSGHARIHQLSGNVTETYAGATLVIDQDWLDGPVAD
ncbi:DUF1906 domain-containing protein [Streptacidiphilus sp. PB12-B1b]|uniref:DUF1906 domain-containing protein n=1 Tax=Streptacidiphilus sp. PB12-B1b TaxID=2705012 RepID=UPI0015F7C54C|nr:DUF1906 domain-containing protein [Streptacidiphilus sp. PB12-B1b]QMU75110.1 DUF1906 domain-containing protein [Streptacidiphilus sp. PB12-B1b]